MLRDRPEISIIDEKFGILVDPTDIHQISLQFVIRDYCVHYAAAVQLDILTIS